MNVNGYNICPGADLFGANLVKANLSGADLSSVNLALANLRGANLTMVNLRGAWLGSADLREARAVEANLHSASLFEADLRGTDLGYTSLTLANLRGARYNKKTRFPSPAMFLMASWGRTSDDLTRDLMLFCVQNHPEPERFVEWVLQGGCPFDGTRFGRSAWFHENPDLWPDDWKERLRQPISALDLALRLMKEKMVFEGE